MVLRNLLSLWFHNNCPLCDRATNSELCPACERQVKSCRLANPRQCWQDSLPLFTWGQYEGKLKRAIAALKYEQKNYLGELMGKWLGESWCKFSPLGNRQAIVVPIPLHPKKLQERGFNQADLIAQGFCEITGYALNTQIIQRVKETKAMFALNPVQRSQNLENAFSLNPKLSQRPPKYPILIIDDIYTTGTTVNAAAGLLRSHQIAVMGVAVVSRA